MTKADLYTTDLSPERYRWHRRPGTAPRAHELSTQPGPYSAAMRTDHGSRGSFT